jgi:hypothetical protein
MILPFKEETKNPGQSCGHRTVAYAKFDRS